MVECKGPYIECQDVTKMKPKPNTQLLILHGKLQPTKECQKKVVDIKVGLDLQVWLREVMQKWSFHLLPSDAQKVNLEGQWLYMQQNEPLPAIKV